MQIPPLSALRPQSLDASPPPAAATEPAIDGTAKVAQQFESILLRQFLGESMKGLLQEGPAGQVYGYMLTDSLANSLSEGGGLGLTSVLQAQLGKGQP